MFALAVAFVTIVRIGGSFDRDRANGTLVFLFLTPLTEQEIAAGKLKAGLIYSLGLLASAVPFLLLAIILELMDGRWKLSLLWAAAPFYILVLLAGFANLNLLCAVKSRKPGTGAANGFAVNFVIQVCVIFLPLIIATLANYLFDLPEVEEEYIAWMMGIWIWLANGGLAIGCWHWAQAVLKKQRYSENITRGKGSS